MDKKNWKTYWDSIDKPYQMGDQKHRIYLLNLLKEKNVLGIFDVGCGTGPIYDIIERNKDNYVFIYKGVDYSPAMIECCREQFPDGIFEVQDSRHLREGDNSWDCVLMLHSLDHVKEYDLAIKEAARVARKYVCIVLWRAFRTDGGIQINDRNTYGKEPGESPWEDTYLIQYSKEILEEEFKKNNLIIEKTAEGEVLNSGQSKYNFLYLLRKNDKA